MRIETREGKLSEWMNAIDLTYAPVEVLAQVGRDLAIQATDHLVVYGNEGKVRFFYGMPEIDGSGHADTLQNGMLLKAYNSRNMDEIVEAMNKKIKEDVLFELRGKRTLKEFSPKEYSTASRPYVHQMAKREWDYKVQPNIRRVKLYRMK